MVSSTNISQLHYTTLQHSMRAEREVPLLCVSVLCVCSREWACPSDASRDLQSVTTLTFIIELRMCFASWWLTPFWQTNSCRIMNVFPFFSVFVPLIAVKLACLTDRQTGRQRWVPGYTFLRLLLSSTGRNRIIGRCVNQAPAWFYFVLLLNQKSVICQARKVLFITHKKAWN